MASMSVSCVHAAQLDVLHTGGKVLRITRDDFETERLMELSKADLKLYGCHQIMNCAVVCPKALNPGLSISKLKVLAHKLDAKLKKKEETKKFLTESA